MKQKKLKILFRTSGGRAVKKQLGLGHINRCVSLSKFFKNCEIYFLIEDYGGVVEFIKQSKIKNIVKLRNNIDLESDIKETFSQIISKNIDILIVDKYDIKIKYLHKLKNSAKIVVISDLKKIDYPADLVVNGFVGFKNKKTTNKFGSKCLLGPSFQILNQNFQGKKQIKKKIYDLLVTVGGFDERNIIKIFMEQFSKYSGRVKTKIILGPATLKSPQIKKMEKRFGNNLSIVHHVSDMHLEIRKARFGLCSGGITSYEFACLNIPFAVICQVKHQLITAKEWVRKNRAVNLGMIDKNTGKKIDVLLKTISKNKSQKISKQKSIVDGLGSKRISREIYKLI